MRRDKTAKNFDYYIEEYMYYCQSKRLRPKTMSSYEQTLRLFERWCEEEEAITEPNKVTESIVRRYICNLQERGKYTFCANDKQKATNCPDRRRDYRMSIDITTINNYIRNIRAFYSWFSYETGTKNPMERIRQLKDERIPKEYLTDEEIEKLKKIMDLSYFAEHRDFMIIMLILDTGMRLGECLMVEIKDINISERTIFLPAEHTKSGKSRYVFFSVKTARMLQRWLRFKDRYSESSLLFHVKRGTKLEITSFESNLRKYLKRAGIKKEYSAHALRNNFAKRCLMAGMDYFTLSKILGHSSVTVTEKAYLDLTESDLRARYQYFSPIENMKSGR